MNNNINSPQQIKTQTTKNKILKATLKLMKKYGYEALSIKNICREAGVSNGSFYHHFKTKDEMLSYYLQNIMGSDLDALQNIHINKTVKEVIIDFYVNYANYCKKIGIDFMSNYYSTKNKALNTYTRHSGAYPITHLTSYLENEQKEGTIKQNIKIQDIAADIRIIVTGNVFEWCVTDGQADFESNIKRSLSNYLDGIIN